MVRLPPLGLAEMSPQQREAFDDIVSGPRGSIAGPFDPWLRSPELASHAQRLGAFCRYGTSLEPVLSELAILMVAARHQAQFEWFAHAPIAIQAGLAPEAAERIRTGAKPHLSEPRQELVAEVAAALLSTSRLSDELFRRAYETLGEVGLVELVGVIGYYTFVALTLNAFEIPLPANTRKPFPLAP
jgi:4-carboxymuconolactone decarboxylase